MSSRPQFNSPEAIARRLAEGRGTGEGPYYIPWINIHDFASWGQRRRSYNHKVERLINTLSRLEFFNYLLATTDEEVIDIQENYPLRREKSVQIAHDNGIKHPRVSRDCAIVMSTDLRLTIRRNGKIHYKIWTTKYTDELRKWRTLEKLKIDELYWTTEPNHSWELRTQAELPRDFLDNVQWLYPALRPGAMLGIAPEQILRVGNAMRQPILQLGSNLVEITEWSDNAFQLNPGTSMQIVQYLLATEVWRTDLRKKWDPFKPLVLEAA